METSTWLFAIVAVVIVALVVFIIIRNKKDKDEYIKTLNASDDQASLLEKDINPNE